MRIKFDQLKDLPVVTQSGIELGKVRDLTLDVENHLIIKYIVKQGLFKNDLLIAPVQVVSITDEKIIVADNVLEEKVLVKAEPEIETNVASPVIEKEG